MRVMKEFGYQVSKDYEKLWELIKSGSKVAGRIDFERGLNGNQIRDIVEIKYILEEYYIGTRGISYTGMSGTKDKFIGICKSLNLTFIDPEPSNPNAIFYADGSEVEVGDVIEETNGNERAIITNPYQGSWEASGDREYSEPICNFENIKWDGNRMTNVEKVEK